MSAPAACAPLNSQPFHKPIPFVVYKEMVWKDTGEFFSVCKLTVIHREYIANVLSSCTNETQCMVGLFKGLVRVDGFNLSEERILEMDLRLAKQLNDMLIEQMQ